MDASITHDRSRIKFPRGWSANTQLALTRTFFDDNDVIEKHFSLVIYFLSFIFGKLFIFDAVIKFLMVTFGGCIFRAGWSMWDSNQCLSYHHPLLICGLMRGFFKHTFLEMVFGNCSFLMLARVDDIQHQYGVQSTQLTSIFLHWKCWGIVKVVKWCRRG